MFPLLLLLMFFFGVSFSLLSPHFQLDNADGPLFTGMPRDSITLDVSAGGSIWQVSK